MGAIPQCIKTSSLFALGFSLACGVAGASVPGQSAHVHTSGHRESAAPAAFGEIEDWLYQILNMLEAVLSTEAVTAEPAEEAPEAAVRARAENFVRQYIEFGVPGDLNPAQVEEALQNVAVARAVVVNNPSVFDDTWWHTTFISTLNSMEAELGSQP